MFITNISINLCTNLSVIISICAKLSIYLLLFLSTNLQISLSIQKPTCELSDSSNDCDRPNAMSSLSKLAVCTAWLGIEPVNVVDDWVIISWRDTEVRGPSMLFFSKHKI